MDPVPVDPAVPEETEAVSIQGYAKEVMIKDEYGQPTIPLMVDKGDRDLFKLLPAHEAELGIIDDFSQVPIHWAAATGHTRIVRLLVERGIQDLNLPYDSLHQTPISLAAMFGQADVDE